MFMQHVLRILQVFQLCDMLDQDASYDERSIVIFLVFLASRLTYRKTGVNFDVQFKNTLSFLGFIA